MDAFLEMLDGTTPIDRPDLLASFNEINSLMGMAQLDQIEASFLNGTEQPARARAI
jgi:hypothetical protein